MTWKNSPWAVDGALTEAKLARLNTYVSTGGAEGVSARGELAVTQLPIAGAGFNVASGGALLLNRYLATPNQTYTALNDGPATYDGASGIMPAVSASARSHLVCVVIGDPEFSQVGHPFMLSSDPPAGEEENFSYVRVVVIPNVPGGTTDFATLNLPYPGYAIARIDLPAGATDVSSSRIVDVRKLARPRSSEEIFTAADASSNLLGNAVNVYENWPTNAAFQVAVPEWATVSKIFAYAEGLQITKPTNGEIRVNLDGCGTTPETRIAESGPSDGNSDRVRFLMGGKINVLSVARGTTRVLKIEAKCSSELYRFGLGTDWNTTAMIRIRFEESLN